MSHSEEEQIRMGCARLNTDATTGCRIGSERPFTPTTLVELLCYRALHQPERRTFTFLEDGERESSHLTHAELDRRARAIAAMLQNLKATGERVLLLYPTGLEYIAAFFGCLYAGAVAVPTYPTRANRRLTPLREIAADAQATVALTTTAILSSLQSSLADDPALRALRWVDTEALPPDLAETWSFPDLQSDSLAFLQYTSGSTSRPKGVMVSHGNLLQNARMMREAFQLTEQSRIVCWLPLHHDMGLIGNVVAPLCAGAPTILMSPMAFLLKPFRWLQAINRYRATISGAPNFAYDLCVHKVTPQQRADLDLSSWCIAFNGAEPVRAETLTRFTEAFEQSRFRPDAIYPCYGLAEATVFVSGGLIRARPVVHTIDVEAFEQGRVRVATSETAMTRPLVGCGWAWPDEKIIIVDPESQTQCPPEQIGEIWVSGSNITKGYWNRAEETGLTFHAYLADTGAGPFLRTGDMGFIRGGELFIAGRLKDLIIIEGRNHYPHDIEETAEQSHPAILPGGCAAFSIVVDGQERLVILAEIGGPLRISQASVTPTIGKTNKRCSAPSGREAITQAIRRAVAENHDLQTYAIQLVKVGNIAKTSSGKLRRSTCRKDFLAGEMAVWGNE